MSKKLVTVIHNTGERGTVVSLEVNNTLTLIREELEKDNLMDNNASFLLGGNPIQRSDEDTVSLKKILNDSNKLYVGGSSLAPLDPQHAIDEWNNFGDAAKNSLFEQIDIHCGLIIREDGFSRSFSDAIPVRWELDAVSSRKPSTISRVTSDYTFSKTTKEMAVKNVQSASISFTSPFASAKAEYEHEKEKKTSEERVTTYFIAKFLVNKVSLQINPKKMKATARFLGAIEQAIGDYQDNINGYSNLIEVLDKYGYYVPATFTLGGALITETSTQIAKFSDAETEMDKYSFGFSAAFDGIGGGAAYSNADTKSVTKTSSNEYTNQTFQQIGGLPGTNNNYPQWVKSLDSANNWDVTSYETLIPTVALIGMSNQAIGNACCNLIIKFSTYNSVKDRQIMIDMSQYAKESKKYFGANF